MASPMRQFDNMFNEPVAPSNDSVTLTITLDGLDASAFMMEASSRGISYNDFAAILLKQGMFFWAKRG